jgi:hypothetical protein
MSKLVAAWHHTPQTRPFTAAQGKPRAPRSGTAPQGYVPVWATVRVRCPLVTGKTSANGIASPWQACRAPCVPKPLVASGPQSGG